MEIRHHQSNPPQPFRELQSARPHTLDRDSLEAVVDNLTQPLSSTATATTSSTSLSPDKNWLVDIHTDNDSGWTFFSLRKNSPDSTPALTLPPARSASLCWFRDSSAFLCTGYPHSSYPEQRPHKSEKILLVDLNEQRVDSLPLPYSDASRVELTSNQITGQALLGLRDGNHRQRDLFSLSLEQSSSLTLAPVSHLSGFVPIAPWKDGFLGISDGATGKKQLDLVRPGRDVVTLVEEQSYILRNVLAGDDRFLLNYYSHGTHRLVSQPLATDQPATTLYSGELVIERLERSGSDIESAVVSRLDMQPLSLPCSSEAFERVSQLLPVSFHHEHHDISVRDGSTVPVEIYSPRLPDISRLLVCVYGAWGVIQDARFHALRSSWLETGGTIALVGVRGGGERGAQWHESGQGKAKQTATHDLIDVTEKLAGQAIAGKRPFVAYGYSAGATVLAAAIAQSPALFSRAVLESGVYDLQNFPSYSFGAGWKSEFGSPDASPEIFRENSPMRIASASSPPTSMMLVSGSNDQTVAPEHTLRFHQLTSRSWGTESSRLKLVGTLGHNLEVPLTYPAGNNSRQNALTMVTDELAFLMNIDE